MVLHLLPSPGAPLGHTRPCPTPPRLKSAGLPHPGFPSAWKQAASQRLLSPGGFTGGLGTLIFCHLNSDRDTPVSSTRSSGAEAACFCPKHWEHCVTQCGHARIFVEWTSEWEWRDSCPQQKGLSSSRSREILETIPAVSDWRFRGFLIPHPQNPWGGHVLGTPLAWPSLGAPSFALRPFLSLLCPRPLRPLHSWSPLLPAPPKVQSLGSRHPDLTLGGFTEKHLERSPSCWRLSYLFLG